MSPPDSGAIRGQLDRIAGSQTFAGSDRMSRLLRYLVDRTLAGEADQLKEYVLGVEVFDRDQRYDPRLDSIVRVEVRRLRSKIDEYYAGPGAADSVSIAIPKGSYVPVFDARPAVPEPLPPPPSIPASGGTELTGRASLKSGVALGALAMAVIVLVVGAAVRQRPAAPAVVVEASESRLSIAVLPFQAHSERAEDRQLAARITDGVTTEVARLGTLSVVSHTSALQFSGARPSMRDLGATLGADVVLEGSVNAEGGGVAVDVRLVNVATDRKFWVMSFQRTADDIRGLQRDIARAVAAAAPTRTP